MKSILKLSFLFGAIMFITSASHASELKSIGSKCNLQMQIEMEKAGRYTVEHNILGSGKNYMTYDSGKRSGLRAVFAAAIAFHTIGDTFYEKCSPSKAEIAKQVEAVVNMFKNQISCEDLANSEDLLSSPRFKSKSVNIAETLKRIASCNADL